MEGLESIAAKYVWWEAPERALQRRELLLCQLMQLGTWEDVRRTRKLLGDDAFRQALRRAPAGVLDARSWNFWHRVLFPSEAVPPLPERPVP